MNNVVYGPSQLGKQTKAKHPRTQTSATSRPLELLHLDFMGPTRTESFGGKRYIMVVVDDFTRYTWVILLRSKSNAPEHIEALCTKLQNMKSLKIDRIEVIMVKNSRTHTWSPFALDQVYLKNSLLILLLGRMV